MTDDLSRYLVNPGPKPPVRGLRAACSSDNAIVTEVMVDMLAQGGNAADAGVAGALVQAAVEPFLTNHSGTVSFLYHDSATGAFHQLHGAGTFPPHLPPFRPVPKMASGYAVMPPAACIPNFMPALKALHERFGRLPWAALCQPAIRWAEEGHPVSTFEHAVTVSEQDFSTYFPESRRFWLPGGFYPAVGERFRNPDLAATLRGVATDGPGHMIEGPWAREFVARANAMGWPITLADMAANPPRWIDPLRVPHRGHEIVTLALPEQQGAFVAMVLGILDALELRAMVPGSADALFATAHALRLGLYFCGFLGDPMVARYDLPALLDGDLHRSLARLIAGLRPQVDLSDHLRLTRGPGARGDGHGLAGRPSVPPTQPPGSCELSIADAEGNWLQLMNTLQSGGIPGTVVGGVPMVGSHVTFAGVSGHFDVKLVPGARMRTIVGNTMLVKDGRVSHGFGTPGNVFCTIPQVIANLLDHGMAPEDAIAAPRHLELGEDGALTVEDRLAPDTVAGLARMGVEVGVMPPWDWHMGSFQMCWREPDGTLAAAADPRRCGVPDGLR